MTTIKRCWVIISTSFILLGSLLRHRVLSLYYNEDRGFFVIFFGGAEAREEDAEGMLRPKPKEQPMSKLCEAWATAARLEETCERSGGGRECARAIEHDQRACGQSKKTKAKPACLLTVATENQRNINYKHTFKKKGVCHSFF